MNVNLHIERVVVEGLELSAADGTRLRAGMEVELTRLISEGGLLPSVQTGAALASLSVGEIRLAPSTPPEGVGRQIAGALYGGIGK